MCGWSTTKQLHILASMCMIFYTNILWAPGLAIVVHQHITCHCCSCHEVVIFPHWTILCLILSMNKWLALSATQITWSCRTFSHHHYAKKTSVHAIQNLAAHPALLGMWEYRCRYIYVWRGSHHTVQLSRGMATSLPLCIVSNFHY
jgi:hypothetical protein